MDNPGALGNLIGESWGYMYIIYIYYMLLSYYIKIFCFMLYIYNWWLMDVIMLRITQTRIVYLGSDDPPSTRWFHQTSWVLHPCTPKNLMKFLLISTLEKHVGWSSMKLLVQHWKNHVQPTTNKNPWFYRWFPMIFLCFSDVFSA